MTKLQNPQTGERFVWRATRQSTGGAYCEFDLYLDAGAKVAAPHRHSHQTEQYTVIAGELALTSASVSSIVGPGETEIIPADTAHQWVNTSGRPAHVVVRVTPALHIQDYFSQFCTLASAGRAGPPDSPATL